MKFVLLFNAAMLSLISGEWTSWYRGTCTLRLSNYTLSSTDSSAYITEICVTTASTSFHDLISITATYSNGDISGPFGGASAADSISSCFTANQENECIMNADLYTGYYLNSLQFGTSSTRTSNVWGVRSGNNIYSARGDEGTCLAKIEITASSSWNRLASIRFDFDAFEASTPSISLQPTSLTQDRIHSTTIEPVPNTSFPVDITLADTGCDGIQYLMDVAVYLPAGVCSVSYDNESDHQYSTMLQCSEDGKDVIFNTYTSTDCAGIASSSICNNSHQYEIVCGVADVSQDTAIVIATTMDTVERISMETTDHEEAASSSGWAVIAVVVVVCLGFCVFVWFKRKWRNAKHDLMHHVLDSAVEAVVHHNEHPHDYHAHHNPHIDLHVHDTHHHVPHHNDQHHHDPHHHYNDHNDHHNH